VNYLLDTNVISELRKRSPDPHVLAWYSTVRSDELFLSVLTVGEIRLGIERIRRKDQAQAAHLEQWLDGLRGTYADRLVSVDERAAQEWGRIAGRAAGAVPGRGRRAAADRRGAGAGRAGQGGAGGGRWTRS
jgi:predicted nucleic acid-binding protein